MTLNTSRRPHQLEKGDHFISSDRACLYDRMARNLHHPSQRFDFTKHYDELFRLNIKHYDLNYPAPPPEIRNETLRRKKKEEELMGGARSAAFMSSRRMSSSTKKKSKYMSELRNAPTKKVQRGSKDQLIERLKLDEGAPFVDKEKLIADIVKCLIKADIDIETIRDAFEDVEIEFVVNESTSELEICLHF